MSEHLHTTSDSYQANKFALTAALTITALIMLVELVGGWLSNSLALISDAGHMLTDSAALILALFAIWFSRKPATAEKTYGFYRSEILAALFNGILLILIAGYIFYEAILRFINPSSVNGLLMLWVAVVGFIANLAGALILLKAEKGNLNVKAAFWHIVSDTLSSAGVIVGAVLIYFTGFYLIDPIIGLIIGVVILRGAWGVLKEAVDILLEATPRDLKLEEVAEFLRKIIGVRQVHDLHIWTISSGMRTLSAHVLVDDCLLSSCSDIANNIKNVLKEKFFISHATLEFECESCSDGLVCKINSR